MGKFKAGDLVWVSVEQRPHNPFTGTVHGDWQPGGLKRGKVLEALPNNTYLIRWIRTEVADERLLLPRKRWWQRG